MRYGRLWGILVLTIAACVLTACSQTSSGENTEEGDAPAIVEPGQEGAIDRVILTEEAAERLDIQTAPVAVAEADSAEGETALRTVIPYSAVLYDVNGDAFVYTNPEHLTYVRAPISVDYIEGERAVLSASPSTGTAVVTVGAAELFGAEFEFQEE